MMCQMTRNKQRFLLQWQQYIAFFYDEYENDVFWLKAPHNLNSVGDKISRKNWGPPMPWFTVLPDNLRVNCFSIGSGKLWM